MLCLPGKPFLFVPQMCIRKVVLESSRGRRREKPTDFPLLVCSPYLDTISLSTVECHELGQKIRILGQGQEQDSSED